MADQPTIQPAMTVIIPGRHGRYLQPDAAAWSDLLASGQRGRFQLVHSDADDEALAVEEVGQRVTGQCRGDDDHQHGE